MILTLRTQRGSVLVAILAVLMFLGTMLLSLIVLSNANLQRARGRIMLLQAQYAAESAADSAIAQLNTGNSSYTGTNADAYANRNTAASGDVTLLDGNQYRATYSVSVANGVDGKERLVTAVGKVYAPKSSTTPTFTRALRITVQRTSSSTASAMMSRNIIEVHSGVKKITGKDIFVNGFIHMSKNTTELIAENIRVSGKNTGAANCSIGGNGKLVKPSSFSDPTQTKTNLILGYNNCISPPGNVSNADFNVSANQGSVGTIQSTYIPWSQYMDGTYQNAPGGCSDWTSGASPRSIPSTGNDKKTHYPDSGSNVSSSCGTSGSIALGSNQYNIRNNVHLRASLCAAAACNPTFNNPDPEVKYIFVEGTVNFGSVKTVSGSGPIVIITYGADPASKASVCPYGGSVYIGQDGSNDTYAPALYLLSMSGLCIDGTKFELPSGYPDPTPANDEDDPVFGGVGGRNLYIASSPSTPRPLLLDPGFPVEEIPIDLSWRAIRYQRL